MNAKQYIETHWRPNKVWNNLLAEKHQTRLRRCAELCLPNRENPDGSEFIDVGCAFGHSTDHMARFRPATWTGMDFDEGAVLEARRRFPQYPFFYAPDHDMLAATRGRTFDSVVCSEVIEHVEDDAAFVRGLLLLARRRVVITTPNVRVKDPGHLRAYTRETLAKLLEGTGRVRILSEGRFFYAVIDFRSGGAR